MIKLQSITLPEGFLREETRDGYTISAKMKEVWAVELDLLQCFVNVCEKNNLRYFMDAGTLLGAVRHQGFIPWDDDVDVTMLWDDYVKLREIAEREFKGPYVFQSQSRRFCKLRNTETTAISRRGFKMISPTNHGIWIDIFPLVGLPPAPEREQFIREILECKKQTELIMRENRDNPSVGVEDELSAKTAQFERLAARYPISPATKKVASICPFTGNDHVIFNYWDFQDTVPLPFEMLTLAAPRGYKNYLRTRYGVWKNPVPQFSHGEIFFDTDRSYEYWMTQPSLPED